MRTTRRTVLIGLAVLVIGGGALFGSGAFSQVEADRTVSVNTQGDSAALLQIEDNAGDFNGVENGTGDTVELQFQDINKNATTSFNGVLNVTNTGSNEVDLQVQNVPNGITVTDANDNNLEDTPRTLGNGETAQLTFEIDTNAGNFDGTGQAITLNATAT